MTWPCLGNPGTWWGGRPVSRWGTSQFPEPLCPFKKNLYLGHLYSLGRVTAHKYCQIPFDSRSLCETGLSPPPSKSKQTSPERCQLFAETGSSFFLSLSLGGPFPSKSNPTQIHAGSTPRCSLYVHRRKESHP